jgi:hypothetical protein
MAEIVATGADGRPNQAGVGVEDVTGVRSRVSWPAVLGGAVFALALYFLLTLFGGAVGLSVRDSVDGRTIGVGAAVYAIVVTALALFLGGFVASQLTAGESPQEGTLYGLFVWALVFAMLLFLVSTGVRAGFGALVGVATAGSAVADTAARNTTNEEVEAALRRAEYTPQQIEEYRAKVKKAQDDARAAAADSAAKQKAEQAAREAAEVAERVTWWAFAGAMLSMAAAAAGGYFGSGPRFRLFARPVARRLG